MKKSINLSGLILLTAVCIFASAATVYANEQIVMKTAGDYVSFNITRNCVERIDWGDGTTATLYDSDYSNNEINSFTHKYSDKRSRTIVITAKASIYTFVCINGDLTSLDVSKCLHLGYLTCRKNQLTSLDIDKCTELEDLDCAENQLTQLDINACPKLRSLSCYNNSLTYLDLSKAAALKTFNCDKTRISSIDLRKLPALTGLSCSGTPISELHIEHCPLLKYLYCSGTRLQQLDCNACPQLEKLDCSRIPIHYLYVDKCTELKELNCSETELYSLDVRGNTKLYKLIVFKCKMLQELRYDRDRIISAGNGYGVVNDSDCPLLPKPNPQGTISINMRNANNGNTIVIINDFDNKGFYIDAENFEGKDWQFVKIGATKGLGHMYRPIGYYIQTYKPKWSDRVSVTPGYGYIARCRYGAWHGYLIIYVVREIISAEDGKSVIGAEIDYVENGKYPVRVQ
ncbi:MAG: hypothetical protein LBP85_03320 [Prevotellaceae bacterium]|jgi:hypothetical protein|nr:hypothetical protein [Prevotellaceae bacterium]